jgi:hypothetical protein
MRGNSESLTQYVSNYRDCACGQEFVRKSLATTETRTQPWMN